MQQTFVLLAKFFTKTRQNSRQKVAKLVPKGSKTCSIRRQNLLHKAAKLTPKGSKLAAKVCTEHSKIFFLHTKKIVLHTIKISFVLQKIAFELQKYQLAHFLILVLSHTFSAFSTLCRFKQIRRTTLLLS